MSDAADTDPVNSPLVTYDDWAEALAGFFFDSAHDGEAVLFAVDDSSLAEASGLSPAAAPTSLAMAVRTVIGFNWYVEQVHRRVLAFRRKNEGGPHPALPFLALTVLAASRMGSDGTVASNNYYVPLRKLIDPSDGNRGAPGSFTNLVSLLWRDLETWANVDLGGHRGRLVIRPPTRLSFVGWAIQHALVRSSDLRRLDDFFRRIGLEPDEEVSPGELRRGLALWAGIRTESWARRLAKIAVEPDLAEYCEALLERSAKRWDGRPRDARTGRAIGRIRVGTRSLRRIELGLYAEWDDRLEESIDIRTDDAMISLKRWHGWYEPFPLPFSAVNGLESGLDLSSSSVRFSFTDSEAYALGFDDDLGGWISTDRMAFGDRYALLVRETDLSDSLRFLREASSIPPRSRNASSIGIPGWALIEDLRIDIQPEAEVPDNLAALLPSGPGPRLRLLGGLPVSSERHVYLRGGEPALALSSLVEDDKLTIDRNQHGVFHDYLPRDLPSREAPLWQLELEPGTYQVTHGDISVTLRIVDGIAETAGHGAGSIVHRGEDHAEVTGVCTTIETGRRRPITAKAPNPGSSSYLIGTGCDQVFEIEVPYWLEEFVGYPPSWREIDAWVPFSPVWQILEGQPTVALPISPTLPPEVGRHGSPLWAELVFKASLSGNQPADVVELWSEYVQKAREMTEYE